MANYDKKEWLSNEVIATEELNNIENGIASAHDRITDVEDKLAVASITTETLFHEQAVLHGLIAESVEVICDTANMATVAIHNTGVGTAKVDVFVNFTEGGMFNSTPKETFYVATGKQASVTMLVNFYALKVHVTAQDSDVTVSGVTRIVNNSFDDQGVNVYNAERLGGQTLAEIQDDVDNRIAGHASETASHGVLGYILGSDDFNTAGGVPQLDGNTQILETQIPDTIARNTEVADAIDAHAGQPTAHHSNLNDPTADEKAALIGTTGAPSTSNRFVTNADLRLSNDRVPLEHGNEKHSVAFATAANLTSHTGNTSNPHAVTKAQVGLGNVTDDAQVRRNEMGAPSGVATLDVNGKVPVAQINDAVLGQVEYCGLWDASANAPALPSTPTKKGDYYVVSVAGSFEGLSFQVGDWIISNGTSWDKVDNTDAVSSVFGRTGNVTAQAGDYTPEQVGAIPAVQKGAVSGVAELDVTGKVPVAQVPSHDNLDGVLAAASGVTHGHITGASQTLAGIKTFSSIPILPSIDPTSNNQATRKAYVDAQVGTRIATNEKGVANGIATLDATGNVPAAQLNNVDAMEMHGDEWHNVEYIKADPNIRKIYLEAPAQPVAGDMLLEPSTIESDLAGHVANTSNPHGVTKAQVGLGNVTNDAQVPLVQKGAALGVATLDATGNVPASQLNNVDAMEMHGDEWHNVSYIKEGDRRLSTGIDWTIRTSAADNQWYSVCYGNGLFVAVSPIGTGNRVMTSPDGINWTIRSSAADNPWRSVCYGNGLFVAVAASGTGNRVMTSPDGINWTIRSSAADNYWRAVCYGNGLFVAVATSGTGNRVMTSPDGINWTIRNSAADNDWCSVCYGNGLFVAVAASGTGNRVMTSPDGINWTIRNSAADNGWRSVCYGNGLFVAVAPTGIGNRVMTSPDGINWTIRNSAADNDWYSVCYGNGLFVAVGAGGIGNRVMTSPDGINWTIRSSAADNTWYSVCYGNGLFVAASVSGTGDSVMTSGYTLENVIPLPKQTSAIPKTVRFDGILAAGNAQQFSALEVDATLQTVRAVLRGSLPVGASIKVQVTKNGASPTDSVFVADVPMEILTSTSAQANGLYVVEGVLDAGQVGCSALDWFQATIVQTGTDYAGNDLDVQLVFG